MKPNVEICNNLLPKSVCLGGGGNCPPAHLFTYAPALSTRKCIKYNQKFPDLCKNSHIAINSYLILAQCTSVYKVQFGQKYMIGQKLNMLLQVHFLRVIN